METKYRFIGIDYQESKDIYYVNWHEKKPNDRWRIKSCKGSTGATKPSEVLIDVLAENGIHAETIGALARRVDEVGTKVYNYVNWNNVLK